MEGNPFTLVLKGLWDMLEAQAEFRTLVPENNRIKLFGGKVKPLKKDRHTIADMPEVTIEPSGGTYNPSATAGSGRIQQQFVIKVMGGEKLIDKDYDPMKWAVIKALADIDKYLDLDFVRRVTIGDAYADEMSTEIHPGWTFTIDLLVELWFSKAILKE